MISAPHPTRRRFLSSISVGLAGALAGCAGDATERTTDGTTVRSGAAGPPSEATLEFDVRSLRSETTTPFVVVASESATADASTGRGSTDASTESGSADTSAASGSVDTSAASGSVDATAESTLDERRRRSRRLIHEQEQAERLQFDIDHERVDAVRSFVEETDYGRSSIILYQRPIGACYDRQVEYVIAESDRYFVQFCRRLRDATTPCDSNVTETEATFVRVPRAYDTPPSSRGSGERSTCRAHIWAEVESR